MLPSTAPTANAEPASSTIRSGHGSRLCSTPAILRTHSLALTPSPFLPLSSPLPSHAAKFSLSLKQYTHTLSPHFLCFDTLTHSRSLAVRHTSPPFFFSFLPFPLRLTNIPEKKLFTLQKHLYASNFTRSGYSIAPRVSDSLLLPDCVKCHSIQGLMYSQSFFHEGDFLRIRVSN